MNYLNKAFFLLVIGSSLIGETLAQNLKREFELILPNEKVVNSLYNSIEYVDSRMDTTSFGIVQVGAFNRKAKVVAQKPFLSQLKSVMNALTDSTTKDGTLLLQLRKFSFAELTGSFSEKGFLNLRAILYSKNGTKYQRVALIDTSVIIKSLDVTKELLRMGSTSITDFISKSLSLKTADSSLCGLNDIIKIDSVEKSKLAVYNTDKYVDGLYYTYNSFKTQMPDKKDIFVEMDKEGGTITSLKRLGENGKKVKVRNSEIYSVIYNGGIYISTENGFYPVLNLDNDLYFTGTMKATANAKDVFVASAFFGIIGGLLASNTTATYEVKIDHVNGGFIPIREIITSTSNPE